MKTLALLLIALAAVGLVVAADAQTSGSPSGSASGSVSTPSGSASGATSTSPGATSNGSGGAVSGSETRKDAPGASNDNGSALPRSAATERTTIFGLSPTAAVIIAAALLVVVILAIVAMTRTGDTYIDTDRKL